MRCRVRKVSGRGMSEGLVWVEAYLPLDVPAFHAFSALVVEKGSAAVAAQADPVLASKALTPIDTHGEAMLQESLIELAHRYLLDSRQVDTMHDRQSVAKDCQVVQSFVNTPEIGSPHFWPGAWVVVLKAAPGTETWERIERGDLDAVSFQAWVNKVPVHAQLKEQA